jgi:hypothetical protein
MFKSIFSSGVYMCTACGHKMAYGIGTCKRCKSVKRLEYYSDSYGHAATERLRAIEGNPPKISAAGIILLLALVTSNLAWHAGAAAVSSLGQ